MTPQVNIKCSRGASAERETRYHFLLVDNRLQTKGLISLGNFAQLLLIGHQLDTNAHPAVDGMGRMHMDCLSPEQPITKSLLDQRFRLVFRQMGLTIC